MAPPPHDPIPAPPLTPQDVTTWLTAMDTQRFWLYAQVPEGQCPSELFWDMATLLHEALEEVRALSTALGEESAAARAWAAALRAQASRLRAHCAQTRAARPACVAPSPKDEAQFERHVRDIFKRGLQP